MATKKKTSKSKRTLGYVVRGGTRDGEGVYFSIRLRIVGIGKDARRPSADDMNVFVGRERKFATVFPPDEVDYAQALADKYCGRVVRLVAAA